MKYVEIVKLISDKMLIRQDAVKKVLRGLEMVMADALEKDEPVRLTFGKFQPNLRPPKPAYDFQNNKKIILPPATVVSFHPSSKIQRVLREKDAQIALDFAKKNAKKNNEKQK